MVMRKNGLIFFVLLLCVVTSFCTTNLIEQFCTKGIVLTGTFTLKSGATSNIYIDIRKVISNAPLFRSVASGMVKITNNVVYDHICGVPYGAVPLSTAMALENNDSLLMLRKELKSHGTQKMVEGDYKAGDTVLLVEDVITTGASILEAIELLEEQNLKVEDIVLVLDRQQGGVARLQQLGYRVHVLMKLEEITAYLEQRKDNILQEDVQTTIHPVLQNVLKYMHEKETNICLAPDVASAQELLEIADQAGPYICILKTHIDILSDFEPAVIEQLQQLAEKHHFLLMEDRKFADVGKTVHAQYCDGVYKVAEWADIVTVHAIAGTGMIHAMKNAVNKKERAAIIIANMSTAKNLTTNNYVASALEMGYEHEDFVIGFVGRGLAMQKPYLLLTPGIACIEATIADQCYMTPEQAIDQGTDIIVVGQAICASNDIVQEAQKYQRAGWAAYQKRSKNNL